MARKAAPIDIYFHMTNHYRKLQKVKSIVDTSPPTGFNNLQNRQSRSSRYENRISSATAAEIDSTERFEASLAAFRRDKVKASLSARSHSLPIRIITRAKPGVILRKRGQVQSNPKSPSISVTDDLKDQVPTLQKRNELPNKPVSDHEYLRFALRIMEDIIRNNLHTNKQIQDVCNSHLEANRDRLDTKRMLQQIKFLKAELNTSDNQENSKEYKINNFSKCVDCAVARNNLDLNCECNVIRNPPLCYRITELSPFSKCDSVIVETSMDEELIKDNNAPTAQLTLLYSNSILQQSNYLFPLETSKVSQTDNEAIISVKDKLQLTSNFTFTSSSENVMVHTTNVELPEKNDSCKDILPSNEMAIQALETVIDSNEIDKNKISELREKIENCTDLKNISDLCVQNQHEPDTIVNLEPYPFQTLKLTNENDKLLIIKELESNKLSNIKNKNSNDDYVLIPGPLFIPKTYLDVKSNESHIFVKSANSLETDQHLVITKNIAVNTDEKYQNIKTTDTSTQIDRECKTVDCGSGSEILFIDSIAKSAPSTIQSTPDSLTYLQNSENQVFFNQNNLQTVDLNCYDLTPQRDVNVSNRMDTKLLLDDKYVLKRNKSTNIINIDAYNNGLPITMSKFFPTNGTQTSLDCLIPLSRPLDQTIDQSTYIDQIKESDNTFGAIVQKLHVVEESLDGSSNKQNLKNKQEKVKLRHKERRRRSDDQIMFEDVLKYK